MEKDLRRHQRFERNIVTIHPSFLPYHPPQLLEGREWTQDRTVRRAVRDNPSKGEGRCQHFVRSPEPSKLGLSNKQS